MEKPQKKPTVLFIGPYPPPYSGPENAMKTLLSSSLSHKFNIFFLKTNVRRSNASKGKLDFQSLFAIISFVLNLIRQIVINRPVLIYYFVTATRFGWLGRDIWCIFISKVFKKKIIIHMRAGHFALNYKNFSCLEKKIMKFACSLVDFGIVQAQCLRNQFKGLIPENKIVAVYNAIETEKYKNENVYQYDKFNILFLGHLSYAKGYCDILKAIPIVAQSYPQIKFYFAGEKIRESRNVHHNQITGEELYNEDPEECYLLNIAGKYDDNYKYLGVLNEEDKIAFLKKSSFLLLPSYSEGFSMSVLEAMAMGKPVVCTPVGALREIITDGSNGFVVPPGNPILLADRILRLLSDTELRNKIAIYNITIVDNLFASNKIAEQLGDVFERSLRL